MSSRERSSVKAINQLLRHQVSHSQARLDWYHNKIEVKPIKGTINYEFKELLPRGRVKINFSLLNHYHYTKESQFQ